MPKILFVATVVKTHIMEFHIPYLKMCKEMGWETAVVARNDYLNPEECVIPYCDAYYDAPFERNPVKTANIKAYQQLKRIIDDGNYDIIHCHTPVGAALTRLAASDARKRGSKVFYTAHGFHFYEGAPIINWIVYYPAERWLAHKTDVLITINREDYERAKTFKAGRVEYIPGVGIDIRKFQRYEKSREEKRNELGIPLDATVLLSVGEVNRNKNHQIVIEALPDFPDAYYVICGQGPLMNDLRALAQKRGVGGRLILPGYRTDIKDFYGMADIFVFPSLREGLPVALMEAMAAELPCVAGRNRGTLDLLPDSDLLFDVSSAAELKSKLREAMTRDCSEEIKRNREHLRTFDISYTLGLMKRYYLEECHE